MAAMAKGRPMGGRRPFSLQLDQTRSRGTPACAGRPRHAPTTLPLKYTLVPPRWIMALFGLADYTASDARRGSSPCSARDGVNEDGVPAVAENRMLVSAESDIGSDYRRMASSVGRHDQGKVRNVSGGHTHVIGVAGGAVEVRDRRLEVRCLALGVLMNVERMLARRQAFDVQLDFHAMRRFAEHGSADVLTLSVFDFHGDRF